MSTVLNDPSMYVFFLPQIIIRITLFHTDLNNIILYIDSNNITLYIDSKH